MKNNLFKNSFVILLITLLAASPTLSYAKNDKNKEKERERRTEKINNEWNNRFWNDDEEDENDNYENDSDNGCLKSYGHFFAFGWLKKNERPEIDPECFFPFGIAKKIGGYFNRPTTTPGTTPDTSPPVITNVRTRVGTTTAIVFWNTNEKAGSAVFWGTTTPVDTASTSISQITSNIQTRNHLITINNLAASTTYYAVVRSIDASNNTAYSSQFSFTTKPPVVIDDTTPPVIHTIITVVGTSTASFVWQTNELATSKVYYGTTTPLDITASSTEFVESSTPNTVHLIKVVGLATSTTYYAVVESEDTNSNIRTSDEFSFITG